MILNSRIIGVTNKNNYVNANSSVNKQTRLPFKGAIGFTDDDMLPFYFKANEVGECLDRYSAPGALENASFSDLEDLQCYVNRALNIHEIWLYLSKSDKELVLRLQKEIPKYLVAAEKKELIRRLNELM